eukprot:s2174_g12.t1
MFANRHMKAPRIDVLEVMCDSQSELTRQTLMLGGKAMRFSLQDGDLSAASGRQKLFQRLIVHRPKHVWYSPVCKPWCMWNQFNAMRSLEQNETVFADRVQHLWQIGLGIVLHEFQCANQSHYHHEQPHGSNMLKVPGAQVITENTYPCAFDLCSVGELRDPVSDLPIRKRLDVRTTSQVLHVSLHKQWCSQDHKHQQIAGTTKLHGQNVLRSKYTELYPRKFARQLAKLLLSEKSKPVPVFVSSEEHPTKKRRLSQKMSTDAIEARFPSISWQSLMQLADRMARRVGTSVVESGPLIEHAQTLCPDHVIKHIVLCRGTNRHLGPNKRMMPGEAPVRKMICIRRKHEDLHVEEEWEPWERLSSRALRRQCVPARVNATIFAQVRSKPTVDVPDAVIHERPVAENVPESKRARLVQPLDQSQSNEPHTSSSLQPEMPTTDSNSNQILPSFNQPQRTSEQQEEPERQIIDLVSQKHGPKFQKLSQEDQAWLLKLHRNMGHPGARKLQHFCQQLGCPDQFIQAIPEIRCSTCLETSPPKGERVSAIHDNVDFGDIVSMDEIVWTNRAGEQLRFYHFIDQSTMYQTAIASPTKQGNDAAQALLQGWIQWAGPPKMLCVDAATELNSQVFLEFVQKFGICHRACATEAHWQNSRAERHGGILQVMLNKMDHEEPIQSYSDLSIALSQATMTKNQWSRHRGFSPEMLVFGKTARIPGSVISDESRSAHEVALQDLPEGQRFRDELAARERARKAFATVDNDQALRRALVSRSRPHRGQYSRGEWVMRWSKKGEADGVWSGPLQVIIQEGHNVVWVTQGNKLYRVAPEHLRPLSAVEEWQQSGSQRQEGIQVDHGQSVVPRHGGIQFHNQVVPTVQMSSESTDQHRPPNQSEIEVSDHNTNIPITNNPITINPPSNNSQSSQDQPDNEPDARGNHAGQIPSTPGSISPSPSLLPKDNAQPEATATNPVEVPIPVGDSDDELFTDCHDCFHLTSEECWKLEVNISQHDIDQWKREESPHHMSFVATAAKRQRSEVKLSQLSAQDKLLFQAAKNKEIDSWLSTDTVSRILRHQIPDGNLLRCRWILTWKPVDPSEAPPGSQQPKHTPKARLVVLGYEDPLVHEIPRDSPTMSKLTRMLILQTAASRRWDLESFDIRTAFLRGTETSNRTLGLEPPIEMRERMRLKPQEVLKLLKGAYGRVDAPYLWFMELKAGLEQVGFVQAPFDPCAFVLPHPVTKQTEGILGVHVDDGLGCGSEYFSQKLQEVAKKFPFGSHKKRNFTFTGLRIEQQPDFSIHINQTQYIKDIHSITLSRERRSQPEAVVSEDERQSLRALIGSLQYAAVNTRPDLCSRLSWLQSEINRAKVSTLIDANRILHEARMHSGVQIIVKAIPIDDVRFVAFSDASFASNKTSSSHQGMVIMACHQQIGQNHKSDVSPILWHSKKIQKVAVSTLSAEAMSLAGAVDVLSWIRLYWGWIRDVTLPWKQADQTLLKLPTAFAALAPPESDDAFTPSNRVQELHPTLEPRSNAAAARIAHATHNACRATRRAAGSAAGDGCAATVGGGDKKGY